MVLFGQAGGFAQDWLQKWPCMLNQIGFGHKLRQLNGIYTEFVLKFTKILPWHGFVSRKSQSEKQVNRSASTSSAVGL